MYRAIIVDDEPWSLVGIQNTFELDQYGFQESCVTMDSDEALQYLLHNQVDLVITDVRMPAPSGIDLIKQARNNGINAEFIFISGFDEFAYAKEAIHFGAFEYLLKPLDKPIVHETMLRLLKKLDSSHKNDELVSTGSAFDEILLYMAENYHSSITLEQIALRFHLNKTYICDLFRKKLNTTFVMYLNELRINQAKRYLSETDESIAEIGRKIGFNSDNYFTRVFKANMGMSPQAYRNKRCVCNYET